MRINHMGYLIVLVYVSVSFVLAETPISRDRRSFQRFNFRIPERAGRKCHDFCSMMPNLCGNGGTCVINEISCVGSCSCNAGWTGKWCREAVTPSSGWSREPMIPLTHNGGHVFQGFNEASGFNGNEGEADNDGNSARVITPKATMANGILEDLSGLGGLLLPTRPSILNMKAETSQKAWQTTTITPQQNVTNDQETDRKLRDECLSSCKNGKCINAGGVYKCKRTGTVFDDNVPRICGPGFECVHGVCDMEALESNSYRCICEESYVGQFCTAKCPLECGEHGHCDIHVPDNTYTCYCQWNYTGLNCSELIPEDPGKYMCMGS